MFSESNKICYQKYKKFNRHVYFAEDAMTTLAVFAKHTK